MDSATSLVPSSTLQLLLVLVGFALVASLGALFVVLPGRRRLARETGALQQDLHDQRLEIERREHRLAEREERLDAERHALEERVSEIAASMAEVDRRHTRLADLEVERREVLEQAAGTSVEAARAEILATAEQEARLQAALVTRDLERAARQEGDRLARGILATVIQRLATDTTAEAVVTTIPLSSDDMKGRIIGREGRNIRAFEQVTGVNLIIDDTPGSVVLSCFDPVRREAGRLTLEELLADGRIHPARIEEVHARAATEIERLCVRAGEDAALEVGISDLHPQLAVTMGRLRYRASYGQNVLRHLVESGHAAGLLADELGVDRALCVRGAFLHDIGKALTHEVEGSHALVGAELARRYGEHEDVVHAIEAHHNEVEPRTVEAFLTQAADAISGGRPGARRETLEIYTERMSQLEAIAMANPGVSKAFAMSAGREVRVMVLPEAVDDIAAQVLARDIAKQYEHDLTYPGQIKVTVIRESRAIETAR